MLLSLSSYGLEELTESDLENVKLENDDLPADCSSGYCGEIALCTGDKGNVIDTFFVMPSGNEKLDKLIMKIFSGAKMDPPKDLCAVHRSDCCETTFVYDESLVDPALLEATDPDVKKIKWEWEFYAAPSVR